MVRDRGWALRLVLLLASMASVPGEAASVSAPGPACGSVTDSLPRELPDLPTLPATGQSYTDPVFGCTITRLTNAAAEGWRDVNHFYSSVSPFNADSTRVLLQKAPGGAQHIRTLSGEIVRDNLGRWGIQPHSEPVWSPTDPDVLYFHPVGGNTLRRYDVDTDTVTVLHTFTGYTSIEFGHWEADISGDGDYLPILADKRFGLIYTISTGALSSARDLLATTGGVAVDAFDVTPSNRAMVKWGNSDGGVAYFDQAMNSLGRVMPYAGHSDRARDADGADLEVAANAADQSPLPGCTNGLVKVRLAEKTETCLLGMTWDSGVQHVSCNNVGQNWCLVSTYNGTPGTVAYTNELFQVKLDGSQTVRLAHSRSTNDGYFYTPRAAVSHDGKYVLFDSSMQGTAIDVYLLQVPDPADTTPPTVTLTEPPLGSTVAGPVTVAATASDNVAVVGVQFKLDGIDLGAEDTVSPYAVAWDTATAANGVHTLAAVARDTSGNTATSELTVTVSNDTLPPPPPMPIATDGFESGTYSGGTGWNGSWTKSGDVNIRTDTDGPQEGRRHVRLRAKSGYLKRSVNLSAATSVHLTFWSKVSSFESSDKAFVKVSPDGVTFTTVKVFTAADSNNAYQYADIDLGTFPMTSTFSIAFDAEMSPDGDFWFLDDIRITGVR
jgi:hypothetical protein